MTGATTLEPLTDHQMNLFNAAMVDVDRIARNRSRLSGAPIDDNRQDGAIGVLSAARRVDPAREDEFPGYAARAARNAMITAERRRGRAAWAPLEIDPPARESEEPLSVEAVEAIRDAVRALGSQTAVILMLRFHVGLSSRAIAARVGWSHARVQRVITRALLRLRFDRRVVEAAGFDD